MISKQTNFKNLSHNEKNVIKLQNKAKSQNFSSDHKESFTRFIFALVSCLMPKLSKKIV